MKIFIDESDLDLIYRLHYDATNELGDKLASSIVRKVGYWDIPNETISLFKSMVMSCDDLNNEEKERLLLKLE